MNGRKVIPTIGRKSLIDMPVFGLEAIPAKIDTGADSSSIWASNIQEINGTLTFVLFDRDSPYYVGKEILTDQFDIVSVKNSFGTAEYRYKVKLPTVIEGKNIHVKYTLSDRAHSKYPVLIGRNTLKGKFVVDVAKRPDMRVKDKMLLLSLQHTENVSRMIQNIEKFSEEKVEIDYGIYDDLIIRFVDGVMTTSVAIEGREKDIADYSLVHFKTSLERDITAAAARYVLGNGGKVVDPAVQYYPGMSKLYQYSILAHAGVAVPDSVFVVPSQIAQSYELFSQELGMPFVIKGLHASRGEMNVVIRDKKDFERAAKKSKAENIYVVGQRFIPNDGDYRVLVFGKQIALVIHRVRKDDSTHLNNTSAGGVATIVPTSQLPAKIQMDCIHAASVLDRGIVGVDMIQDSETGEWYCLEVNDGPQLATGAFTEEKHEMLAKYLMKELEK